MVTHKYRGRAPSAGFTLIELMVTIVIATILLSIAIPSYQAQIRKSRRTEARNALLDLAAREERYFSTANAYSQTPADLGYTAFGAANPIGSGYYYLTVTATAAAPATNQLATYTLTATATGTQVNDTSCRTFTVNQLGQQSSQDGSTNDTTTTCWN